MDRKFFNNYYDNCVLIGVYYFPELFFHHSLDYIICHRKGSITVVHVKEAIYDMPTWNRNNEDKTQEVMAGLGNKE